MSSADRRNDAPSWTAITFTAAVLVLGILGATAQIGAQEAAEGRKVFDQEKCGLCHAVASIGVEAKVKSDKMKGPDLGGYETEDKIFLFAYLRQEEKMDNKKHRRAAKSSDEELQALVDWLASLEAAE